MQAVVSGNVSFGKVPKEHWEEPEWIDKSKAAESRKKMEANGVIYGLFLCTHTCRLRAEIICSGGSESYRRMCRFQSGFFFQHPLLQQYDYYWRLDPSVKFFCDITEDPFAFMEENNKEYGFTISIKEYEVRHFLNAYSRTLTDHARNRQPFQVCCLY